MQQRALPSETPYFVVYIPSFKGRKLPVTAEEESAFCVVYCFFLSFVISPRALVGYCQNRLRLPGVGDLLLIHNGCNLNDLKIQT